MKPRNIAGNVFYIGVNDRNSERFENLWPLPYGVSYNSYFVKGEKFNAMIDSVENSSVDDCLLLMKNFGADVKVDFLVVNHMEPDHSGGIPALTQAFPDAKIVGNRQTINMVKGYYGIEDEKFLEIKDGDTLDLGGSVLRFILTPMVHWPETMMTFHEQEGILFSGDAFGCFGALDGGVLDSEMDTEWYVDEMYRYYSNIVGKYGMYVQKALSETKDLPIKYICSTHGPVWHEKVNGVVELYDRLSRYEGEPGVTIVYGSMYGNTAKVAETIAQRLCERGVRKIKVHNASKSPLSDMISDAFRYKGLIVGSPTYSMRVFPPVEEFMNALETRELKNRVMAVFGSFTWASKSASALKDSVERMKQEVVASMEIKQAPAGNDFEAAVVLADAVADHLK